MFMTVQLEKDCTDTSCLEGCQEKAFLYKEHSNQAQVASKPARLLEHVFQSDII